MKTLLDEKQLNDGVQELADAINKEYGDSSLTIVGVLTGSVVLMADLNSQTENAYSRWRRLHQQLPRYRAR